MKIEKIRQVVATYRQKFEELGVGKASYPHEEPLDSFERGLEHCHAMIEKMEGFILQNRMDKVFRWLGFLQGYLWSQKIYTLDEITNHNRKDPE
jgi:hypothetical protein